MVSRRKTRGQWWEVLLVCRRRGMKANASKSKVMMLNGEEGLRCEIHVDKMKVVYL